MVVNSRREPLNCRAYDSALVTIEAKFPAAGRADGRTHASTVTASAGLSPAVLAAAIESLTPSNDAARSAVSEVGLAAPGVTPWRYVPVLPPAASVADGPD